MSCENEENEGPSPTPMFPNENAVFGRDVARYGKALVGITTRCARAPPRIAPKHSWLALCTTREPRLRRDPRAPFHAGVADFP